MIIVMRHDATSDQVKAVVTQVEAHGMRTHLSDGDERTVIGVIGTNPFALRDLFVEAPGVAEVVGATDDAVQMQEIFRFERTGVNDAQQVVGEFVATGYRPQFLKRLQAAGVDTGNLRF